MVLSGKVDVFENNIFSDIWDGIGIMYKVGFFEILIIWVIFNFKIFILFINIGIWYDCLFD